MQSGDRVRVVEHLTGEAQQASSAQAQQATLLVDGHTVMHGDRSRMMLLGSKLVSLFAYEESCGRTPNPECFVIKRSIGAHRRERSTWIPAQDGWLHAVIPLGNILVTGIWVDGARSLLKLAPVHFPNHVQIETELLNPLGSDASAELVLLASVNPRKSPSRRP